MKRTIMVLFFGMLAIALFSCPVIASVSVNFCEYLPLSVGNKWTYVGDSSKLYYTEIIGTEIINDEFTFQETQKDKDIYNNRICEDLKIKEVGQNGVAWDPPRYWDGIDVITAEHKHFYSIEPQVVTPAGTFTNVIKISYYDINETSGQFALSRVEYLSKGVGMVKDVNYNAQNPVNPGSYTNTYLLRSFDVKPTPDINLSDYRNWSTVGSRWTYSYIYPLGLNDFTVSISKVTSGQYNGMLRIGDWYEYHPSDPQIYWIVYEMSDGYINIYQYGPNTSDIPWILNEHELECFVSCSVYPGKKWYVRKEEKITVPAGTFYDILVMFDIDSTKGLPPNSANYTYGLDTTEVPYAVTNIHWYARNFGEVKGIDIDSATGNIVHVYELKSSYVPSPVKTMPWIPLLLLDD